MSQTIPVDILSDSDTDSGGGRRKNFRNEAIDLTTPPPLPQSKKKQRIDAISNPSNSTVFIIDDDPTPCKKTSASTPSFVAETPFSGASFVKCSTRKCSISGDNVATGQLVVADTPMSEVLKSETSRPERDTGVYNNDYASLMLNHNSDGESVATKQLVVADTPMSEVLKSEASHTERDTGVYNSDYASLMLNHYSGDNGPICVDSDNESENVGVFRPLELEGNVFAAKLTDASEFESRLVEPSFSIGESISIKQLVVADTPMSEALKSEASRTERDTGVYISDYASLLSNPNSAENNGPICVDSDNESENVGVFRPLELEGNVFAAKLTNVEPSFSIGNSVQLHEEHLQNPVRLHILEGCSSPGVLEDDISVACDDTEDKASDVDPVGQVPTPKNNSGCHMKEKKKADGAMKPKGISKGERLRLVEERKKLKESLMEERKKLKEQEKLLKAASKAEAAELKKSKKEMQKWEKGKYALKSIVAEIDKRVVELGSIGGHLLTRFAQKGLSYRITSNPVERSIIWNMAVPEEISSIAPERIEISYVLLIYEAEEFCNLVKNESLMDHIRSVQNQYPHHTICYLTNRLMAYINKREQANYKNPAKYPGWKRPAIEEVLAKLATHYFKVHSRLCIDEAEVAEHVVGLTSSLASCQFRKKLTRLSVNANGSVIPKDCTEKNLIKKDLWLKALVAIPKVQPRFVIAIWKKYPTMKSLLKVYMDPAKSVHEKEFLLKDLNVEGLLGDDRRLGEVCSKRIYRVLTAQRGTIKTDDVENGADFFS